MTAIESNVENRGSLTRRLEVRVPSDRVSKAVDEAFDRLRGRAKLPGFRQGKVPRKLLEQHYGASVLEDVVKELIESSCAEALRSHELDIVSAPVLVEQNLGEEGDLRYTAEVEVRPTFDLKDYRGRELVRRVAPVSDADVDEAIRRLRERMAQLVTEEERVNVAQGDIVVFDMFAFSEGKPLDAASGEGYTLEVGSGRFPAEFEKQLVGVTRGIRTPIEIQFPEEFAEQELAGKLVRFEVTVKEIKNKILPALDDEFVHELDIQDCDTLEQLRAKVREDLERHAARDADRRARNLFLEQFVDDHTFDVPQSHVERQAHSMLHDMGVGHDAPADKVAELQKAMEPAAVKHVKARFVLDAVAKAEAIEVTEDELRAEVNRQLAAAGASANRVKEHYSERGAVLQLHANMVRDKALQRIIELSAQRDEMADKSELAER